MTSSVAKSFLTSTMTSPLTKSFVTDTMASSLTKSFVTDTMTSPVTKSYVNAQDTEYPVQEDLVMHQLFDKARRDGFVGEIVNLETGNRATTIEILDKVVK